jgi:hypothetical protein
MTDYICQFHAHLLTPVTALFKSVSYEGYRRNVIHHFNVIPELRWNGKSTVRSESRCALTTRKTRSSIERTIVSKNRIKQLNTTGIALQPLFNN